MSNKSFLCLDFGAGNLKAAEFGVAASGALSLRQFKIKPLGPDAAQDSKREKVLAAAVQDLFGSGEFSAKRANISAPGYQVFSKVVKLPPVDAHKVRQIIQYEAQQNIPYPLDQAVWDFQILGSAPSGEVEVMLVAMKADAVESMFRVSEAAGLRLELVDATPAALCNAFRYNYGDLDGCTMLLDIGARTSHVLLFEKGKVFARSISIGANTITQEFVAETKMPFAKAEEIKIKEGFVGLGGSYEEPENPHAAALSKIARQVMTRLHIQVNQTIQFYRGQNGGSAPTRLFLAGGASIMPYTAQFFAEKLSIAIEYFNPLRNITIEPSVNIEELSKSAHSLGEVVGMALRNIARCPVELNLVPKSIRAKQSFDRKKPYFIATMASLILVVFGIGFFYSKVTEIKREALAHLNEVMRPIEKRAEEMEKTHKLVERAKDEMEVYTGYLRDRFFWPEALVEMRKLLVNVEDKIGRPGRDVGVWIENFGAVNVEDIEEQEGAAPTQSLFGPNGIPTWMTQNPEMVRRINPVMYEWMKSQGLFANAEQSMLVVKPQVSTNLVTINVKFRAVNLNNPNDPSANGRLAFAVAEEFKKSGLFDASGTKLVGDLEEPEMIAKGFGTFRFNMTLKLKNEMQL